ncbi:hypothetical protein GJR96_03850 [Haloferax sp. MBLA0076]|uniref:Uncharacterized protein n=1 Tax=Haloferax litoreum TaxID=2666140 RepID=A0A6A8GE31_9EURY|nr:MULTISPECIES: hypothetical protein [Haloferax]KAB1192617.1 hypothetical protein Hfx1148_03845 [Haloferax sp. CBA1148]MRX21091.1 hypothetical protein [Haloferax litoreum]
MAERVPEFALLIGVFLGLSATVSAAVLTGALFRPLLFGVVVCYPFVAFGIVRSDGPTEALPPRVILGIGVALGVVTMGAALLERPSVGLVPALLAATVVVLPPAAYATRFGAGVNPLSPMQTLVAAVAVGATFLAFAPLLETLSAVLGLVIGLSGALYADARGFRPTYRQQRIGIVAGVLLGLSVAVFGLAMRLPLDATTAAAASLVVAPSLFVALTRGRRR